MQMLNYKYTRMNVHIASTDGIAINSTKEWGELAPPMNPTLQWQDYHSAKELAKSVFDNSTLAPKISSVLERFNIPAPKEILGIPEKGTKLPWGRSGDRKHDLFLHNADSTIVIGIEAKADESFDKPVNYKRKRAKQNADGGVNMSERLDGMLNFLYNDNPPKNKEELMYQLLSATAGVVLEAIENKAKLACVMFLVFNSDKLSLSKKKKNEADWLTFCHTMNIDAQGGVVNIRGIDCLIIKEEIELV